MSRPLSIPSSYSHAGSALQILGRYLLKYKRRIGLGVVALFIITPLEALLPLLTKQVIDQLTHFSDLNQLKLCALAYIAISVILALLRVVWRINLAAAAARAGQDLRISYIECLMIASQNFYAKRHTGNLTALANNDIESVRFLYDIGIIIMIDALMGLITFPLVMLWLSPRLALMVLSPLLLIPFISFYNDKRIQKRFRGVQEAFSALTAQAQESLLAISVVKSFARESSFLKKYSLAAAHYSEKNRLMLKVEATFGPVLELAVTCGVCLHLCLGGGAVLQGLLSLGTFVAMLRYLQQLLWPMHAVGLAVASAQKAHVGATRLSQAINEAVSGQPRQNSVEFLKECGGTPVVELKAVSFTFEGATDPNLRNASLKIFQGEKIAIVGEVGCGKTSLLSLIAGIIKPAKGEVWIAGANISECNLAQIGSQISFVPQEPFIFKRSVLANIAFAESDHSKSEILQRSQSAARIAAIHDEIMKMPIGYDSLIGERGINLSGGQKQRISIARAIYRASPILIFDDALSAVDMQSEALIMANITKTYANHTLIFAGQRFSTVRYADRIVVMKAGSIIQCGSHLELMQDAMGWYRRFYEEQMQEQALETFNENL